MSSTVQRHALLHQLAAAVRAHKNPDQPQLAPVMKVHSVAMQVDIYSFGVVLWVSTSSLHPVLLHYACVNTSDVSMSHLSTSWVFIAAPVCFNCGSRMVK